MRTRVKMAASLKMYCHRRCFCLNKSSLRHISNTFTNNSLKQTSEKNRTAPPPEVRENDWIGPPDKVSNIRHMEFFIPKGETDIEKKYRLRRQAVLEWHHDFWTAHNKSFFTKKEEFIQQRLAEKQKSGITENNQSLTPEELSEFYKKFLDENYKTHIQYNKEWYKKNLSLLWPAVQVNFIRLVSWLKNGKRKNT